MPPFDKIKTNMAFDVKITTLFRPLDLVAPFTCRGCGALGEILCGCCKNYNKKAIPKICPRCKASRKDCKCEVPVYAVARREGVLVDLTEDYKYKSIRRAAEVLAELMDEGIWKGERISEGGEASDEGRFWKRENVVVVPLPTVTKHIRERGFDHTLLLAKKLAKRHKGWRVQKLLERQENTVQVGTSGDKRREQAKRAYKIGKRAKIDPNVSYLLIDDVWTTGASMEAAIEKMQDAGAKNIVTAVILMP